MAKKTSSRNKKSQSYHRYVPYIAVLIGIVIIAVAVVALGQPATTSDSGTRIAALISPEDYISRFAEGDSDYVLVDVRTPEEFASGHIEGAINIPVQVLEQSMDSLPSDKTIVVYCRSGNRSATATGILSGAGFAEVYDIAGGTNSWTSKGLPLQ